MIPSREEIEKALSWLQPFDTGTILTIDHIEALITLLSLAEAYLTADEPKEYDNYSEKGAPIEMDNFEASAYSKGVVFGRNQALSESRLYLMKKCEGVEEIITNSTLSKALGDKYIKKHKGAEFGVFVWDKAITDLSQAITKHFTKEE